MARSLKCTVFCVNMGSQKNFIENTKCKVIELGKLYTSMIFFPKNLNSFIGEYAKNRAKRVNKILHFLAGLSLKNIIKCAYDLNIMVIRALVHEIEGAACRYRRCGRPSGFFDVQSELSSQFVVQLDYPGTRTRRG